MNDEIEYLRKVYQSEDTSTWVNKLQMKSIVDYADKLQSNWNILREYAEAHIEVCENRLSTPFCNFEKATKELMIHQNYLDKMNELEGKNNVRINDNNNL